MCIQYNTVSLQVLLRLTRDLFEDTTCLELVIKKVMLQSLELIPSERCAVLLLDQDNKEVTVCSSSCKNYVLSYRR